MNNKSTKNIDYDTIAFFLNSIGSIANLFITINEKRRLNDNSSISKEKIKLLQKKIRILFLFISIYFLIKSIKILNELKENNSIELKIKKQELDVLASLLLFLSSLISIISKDEDVLFI